MLLTKSLLKYQPTLFQWVQEHISKSLSDRRNKVNVAVKLSREKKDRVKELNHFENDKIQT